MRFYLYPVSLYPWMKKKNALHVWNETALYPCFARQYLTHAYKIKWSSVYSFLNLIGKGRYSEQRRLGLHRKVKLFSQESFWARMEGAGYCVWEIYIKHTCVYVCVYTSHTYWSVVPLMKILCLQQLMKIKRKKEKNQPISACFSTWLLNNCSFY